MNCKCMTCWQNGPMDCRHHHRHCQRVCTCIMCHLRYHGIDVIMYIYKTFYCQELALFTWLLLLTVTIAAAVVFTLNVVGWCVSSVWLFWLPLSLSHSHSMYAWMKYNRCDKVYRKHLCQIFLRIASHLNFNSAWVHNVYIISVCATILW